MKTRIFILASGEQVRFEGVEFKQLLEVKGQKVIRRIQEQFEVFYPVYTITHHEEITGWVCDFFKPEKHKFICETLQSSSIYWTERNIILLGDVIYTEKAVNKIVMCKDEFMMFGDGGEIFALSFTDRFGVLKAIDKVSKNYNGLNGKLWNLYRAYNGFDLDDHKINENNRTIINDDTLDIDTLADYELAKQRFR